MTRMTSIILDGSDVTQSAENISWSNSDPGGCEAATFTYPTPPRKGSVVLIQDGLEPIFRGRVDGPDRDLHDGKGQFVVNVVGDRAVFTDTNVSMIYLDRSLGNWEASSVQRRINLLAGGINITDLTVATDSVTPELHGSEVAPFVVTSFEGMYDAGPFCKIGYVEAVSSLLTWAAIDSTGLILCDNDDGATNNISLLTAPAGGTITLRTLTGKRFAWLTGLYNLSPALTSGKEYVVRFGSILIVGDHGLTLESDRSGAHSLPYSTIAFDTARRAGIPPGYIVRSEQNLQASYRDPVTAETIIDEQAKLAGGWHWGVWPKTGTLTTGSEFRFSPPPTRATCMVDVADVDSGSLTERMSNAYDVALVGFTDAGGRKSQVTVRRPSVVLGETGVSRQLLIDAGVSTKGAAQVFGLFMLALSDTASRATGSLELPLNVALPGGGHKRATLLRAGVDRLKINGLNTGSPLRDQPADTFHISRVSCSVQSDGSVTTSVELDAGADLIEVLQARVDQATQLLGT